MKKNMNKIFGIFIAASLTANCGIGIVHAESGILSISDTKTIISLNEKDNYVEGTFGDSALADLDGVVFTSDNENVLTVDEYGEIIEKNYGSATVTASYEGASASVLITVTPENLKTLIDTGYGRPDGTVVYPNYEDIRDFNGGYADSTRIKLANMSWANWGGNNYTGISYENTLQQAWFYDNGQSEASEAGLQFAAYSQGGGMDPNGGTGVIGVLKSADASYRISDIFLRNPGTGNTDLYIEHLNDDRSTDTGIARTKGWHQVSLLNAKDSNGSVIFKLYFDGQLIKVYDGWSAFPGIINMYAGTDSNHVAQFKMPDLVEYHELSDVKVSAGANGITASYEYNGNAPVASYQWYEAGSADSTDWTAIEGANEAVYANANESKYYRVGVKISDTTPRKGTAFVTNEVYSAPLSIKDIELSISSTKSAVALNEEGNKVSVMYGNTDISGASGTSYSSDNEDVLTVSENGEIIEKNYGSAKVTASYKGKTVSMLITVTPENLANLIDTRYGNNGVTFAPNYGETYNFNGGYADSTRIKLANMSWANWGGYTGISYENTLQQAWFYDNGQSEASEAGLQFAAYSQGGGMDPNGGTGVIGVLKSADASYRISNIFLRNPGTGNTDLTVEHLSDEKSTDTGIARTKGWHQVSLLNAKDSNGSVIFKLYFDGQLIKVYDGWNAFPGIINMYAGTDSNHVAQFKMPDLVEYHELSDVKVSADANGITASYEYNGNAPVASYQWYEADSADSTDWTAIEGANEAVYANANESKYYRVGVKISDTTPRKGTAFVTNEVYSAPFKYTRVEETSLSYQNGTVTVSAKDAISNGVLIITSYNENDGYKTLADVKFQAVNCAAYSSVNIQVGDLTGGHKIMLWNSLSDMVPYCPATTVGN